MDWEKKQNEDMEREKEAESMRICGQRAWQALVARKKVQEYKNHQLLRRLNKT